MVIQAGSGETPPSSAGTRSKRNVPKNENEKFEKIQKGTFQRLLQAPSYFTVEIFLIPQLKNNHSSPLMVVTCNFYDKYYIIFNNKIINE